MYFYTQNSTSPQHLFLHLKRCSEFFVVPLACRVNLVSYADKICQKAHRFECFDKHHLVGLLAVYVRLSDAYGYITNFSVVPEYSGRGIGTVMMEHCLEWAQVGGINRIELEVHSDALGAIRLYQRFGFEVVSAETAKVKTVAGLDVRLRWTNHSEA